MENHCTLPREELSYWLALWLAPGVGSKTIALLLKQYPTLSTLFSLKRAELELLNLPQPLLKAVRSPNWQKVDEHLQWAEAADQHIITWQDALYPQQLLQIYNPPPILFIKGDPSVLNTSQLAMVGSRNCSVTGRSTAVEFAYHLAEIGLTITSGLALGIDGASHRGALDAKGQTIAIMGTGLATVYPRQHQKLAEEIIANGALISELPLDAPIRAQHFPRRNRIISGLTLGTLIIEASVRSGSLITARYALEQNREVFTIPGSIHNPVSKGCHLLLKQGAKLVETVADITEELGLQWTNLSSDTAPAAEKVELPVEYQQLLTYIDYSVATPIDLLVEHSQQPIEKLSAMLLRLELEGWVLAAPGGYVRKSTT